LFYKKASAYVSGQNDEVLWTKPYMLPEVFPDIIVPSHLMKRKPPEFDYQKHLEKIANQKKKEADQPKSQRKRKTFNIDKLVDDISRIYISQQEKAGVTLTPQEIQISKRLNQTSQIAPRQQGKGRGRNVGDYVTSNQRWGKGQENYSALKQNENITYYGDDFSYDVYCSSSYYGDYCYYGEDQDYYGDEGYYGGDSYGGNSHYPQMCSGWGFEDHNRQRNSPPKGRGRGLLGIQPMNAYSQTLRAFKK
jgi:hypothetical protein